MGFGPTQPDAASAARAVRSIIELLYPERATPHALHVLDQLVGTLLRAKVPISFTMMQRFLQDPKWRAEILSTLPGDSQTWSSYEGRSIDSDALDPNFGWLLRDRLAALDVSFPSDSPTH